MKSKVFFNTKGYALIFTMLIIIGVASVTILVMFIGIRSGFPSKGDITRNRMIVIRKSIIDYYIVHQDLPDPGPSNTLPVNVLNVDSFYKTDAWGRPFYYDIARVSVSIDGVAFSKAYIKGMNVDSTSQCAGVIISTGPNQKIDYTKTAGSARYGRLDDTTGIPDGTPKIYASAGDDILLPIDLSMEAQQITSDRLKGIRSLVCTFARSGTNKIRFFDSATASDTWTAMTSASLLSLSNDFRIDPWTHGYQWVGGTCSNTDLHFRRFFFNGKDETTSYTGSDDLAIGVCPSGVFRFDNATDNGTVVPPAIIANGKVMNAIQFNSFGFFTVSNTAGMSSKYSFDISDPFSTTCWINLTGSSYMEIISKGTDSIGYYQLSVYADSASPHINSYVKLRFATDVSHYQDFTGTFLFGDFFDGNWHHLAVTYTGSTCIIYRDGSPVTSSRVSLNPPTSIVNTSPLTAGKNISNLSSDGLLDELYIYEYVLTNQEVNAIYKSY